MIETDYLVIGAGAMGMAFSDVLITESDATVVIVDRHGKPGGHWNDAYPFVRLHQPSAFYGVNSRRLGSDQKDATGWNRGLYELASGAEVLSYYVSVASASWTSQALRPTTRRSQHIVDTRLRGAMTPSVSQALWAPNGSMLRSFNIAERSSVPKIARLERHGSTIFLIQNCQGHR